MKTSPAWNLRRRLGCAAWMACAAASTLPLVAATSIQTDHDAYYPGEDILISFAGGPGGAKDWIGVYQPEQEPGPVPSTIWRYVDGTQTGAVGFQNGTVSFPAGLALSGDWVAYFLLNDGYTVVATNQFKVVDPGSPLVRASRRTYTVGETISISFTNGPANPKDWLGIYKEGEVPGGPQSTLWAYVDGTQNGNVAHTDGTVTFASGLAAAGNYVVHFLLNDGYDILASETFRVEAASASVLPRIVSVSPS
ncbi:MAG: hypothetical protein IT580_04575, partial [Verrucomicrobiales bacterium]|nr:hypothetical protein [Verrucomicrobiales bacterium]